MKSWLVTVRCMTLMTSFYRTLSKYSHVQPLACGLLLAWKHLPFPLNKLIIYIFGHSCAALIKIIPFVCHHSSTCIHLGPCYYFEISQHTHQPKPLDIFTITETSKLTCSILQYLHPTNIGIINFILQTPKSQDCYTWRYLRYNMI